MPDATAPTLEGYTLVGHPPAHPDAAIWRTPTGRFMTGNTDAPRFGAGGWTRLADAVLHVAGIASQDSNTESIRRVLWAWECAVPPEVQTGGRAVNDQARAAWITLHRAIQTAKLKLGPAPIRPSRSR